MGVDGHEYTLNKRFNPKFYASTACCAEPPVHLALVVFAELPPKTR